jgi:hypothetical protein
MLEVHNSQGAARGRRRKGCPLHALHVVDAVKEGSYVARCLAWGGGSRASRRPRSEASLRPEEMALGDEPALIHPTA